MTGLIQTRPDHGAMHTGKFAAYVRVSTDKQDNENQRAAIKAYLNGGDYTIEWFEDECSAGTPWHNRKGLQDCINYARKHGATMVVYSVSRLSRKTWEGLRFLDQQVSTGKVQFVAVDNPLLDHKTVGLLAAVADMERTDIKARTKMSLARIQAEIAEKGSYVTKAGRTISKLGATDTTQASLAGNAANARKALVYATQLENLFKAFVKQGMSFREMASELNKIGILTPRKAADPDMLENPIWHASSTRNYVKRLIKAGAITPASGA
jgi:DNA invertase Pin-like site-specific DNA recombinase